MYVQCKQHSRSNKGDIERQVQRGRERERKRGSGREGDGDVDGLTKAPSRVANNRVA